MSGNTAVVAGTLQPNSFGFAAFINTLVDNGPANSGLDTLRTSATVADTAPTVCPPPSPSGNTLAVGDIVVTDVDPLPTSKDQCKNGGWRSFGAFKNQGDRVSFVETGGQNPPARP